MRTSLLVRYKLFDIMNPTSIWLLCDGNRGRGRGGKGQEKREGEGWQMRRVLLQSIHHYVTPLWCTLIFVHYPQSFSVLLFTYYSNASHMALMTQ